MKVGVLLFATVAAVAYGGACPIGPSDPGSVVGQGDCTVGDKEFGAIALVSGTVPTTATVRYFQQIIAGEPYYTVQFAGSLDTAFSVQYDVTVTDPHMVIDRVSADLSNPSHVGSPTSSKIVADGAYIGTITATATDPGVALTGAWHHLNITDIYSPNGGAATSFGNTFHQSTAPTPEPATLGVCGVGLIVIASRLRKRTRG